MDTGLKTVSIVISFSGTMCGLVNGNFTPRDLEGALFYFTEFSEVEGDDAGAKYRRTAKEFGRRYREFFGTKEADRAFKVLHTAVLAAMEDKPRRVIWHDSGELESWAPLNEMLMLHDLPLVDPNAGALAGGQGFNYWKLTEAIARQKLPYRVLGYGV